MKVIALEQTDVTVPDLAELVKEGPVILTLKGKPLAAIQDLRGSDWESIALANEPRFIALIEESRREYREKGGNSLEDIRRELGLLKNPRHRTRKRKNRSAQEEE
jgi:hypothetical protein